MHGGEEAGRSFERDGGEDGQCDINRGKGVARNETKMLLRCDFQYLNGMYWLEGDRFLSRIVYG